MSILLTGMEAPTKQVFKSSLHRWATFASIPVKEAVGGMDAGLLDKGK